ncbi:MAG: homoserine dehydrogenase [Cloacibacillus sp.]
MINNIALAGCGNVGTALLELLHDKQDELREKYGFEFKVVLISDLMKGVVMNAEGLDLDAVLAALHERRSFSGFMQAAQPFDELLHESGATILAECTPTDLKTGGAGLSHLRSALARGISVATTNKGPLAVAFDELTHTAEECGARLAYEGVVMSGTPLIDMVKNGIAGCSVLGFEGILNGTTNFILTKMGEGATYADALIEATSLGYAEADPSGDVEGWDAAVKVAILSKIIYGKEVQVKDITRIGITQITPRQIEEARKAGFAIKLIAGVRFDSFGMHPYVMPKEISLASPLASINGATNAITIQTDNLGDITISGPGAGRRETAQALLGDMIRMGSH